MINILEHFNLISLAYLATCIISTSICLIYRKIILITEISYNVPGIFYLLIFSLSVSFLIDADFTRREGALNYHAELRSHVVSTYLISRSWRSILNVDNRCYESVKNLLVKIMVHINEYLQTPEVENRHKISSVIYEDLNDLSVHLEKFGIDQERVSLDAHTPQIWFVGSRIIGAFERLRVIREYQSPYTQRSFTKIYALVLPLVFAPWFVYMSKDSRPPFQWLALMYNGLFSFILNGQTLISDRLFDPFLYISSDQIDLSKTFAWIDYALQRIEKRNYVLFDYVPTIPCGKAIIVDQSPESELSLDSEECQPFRVDIKGVKIKGKYRIRMTANIHKYSY